MVGGGPWLVVVDRRGGGGGGVGEQDRSGASNELTGRWRSEGAQILTMTGQPTSQYALLMKRLVAQPRGCAPPLWLVAREYGVGSRDLEESGP
jgi:hypothetical protein